MRDEYRPSWLHRGMLNSPASADLERDLVAAIEQHLGWSATRLADIATKHAAAARDLAIVLACLRGEITTLNIGQLPAGDQAL
jgi:hypothetical protein